MRPRGKTISELDTKFDLYCGKCRGLMEWYYSERGKEVSESGYLCKDCDITVKMVIPKK